MLREEKGCLKLIFLVVENLVTVRFHQTLLLWNYEMRSWMSRLWRDTDLLSNSESECISRKKIDEIPRFHGEAWRKESKVVFQTSEEFRLRYTYMGVSKNRGVSPQIIHLFIGFSIIFPIHFGGKIPLFLVQHPYTTHIHHRLPTWSLSSHGLAHQGWWMKISRKKLGAQVTVNLFFSESNIHILHPSHPFPTSTVVVSRVESLNKNGPWWCGFFCFLVWGGGRCWTNSYISSFFLGGGYGMGDGKIREANQYCHQLAGESWTRAKGYGRGFLKDLSLPWSPFPKANVLRSTRMLWIATISWSLLRTRTDRGMFQNPSNDDACFTFSQPANRWLPIWPLTIHTCLCLFVNDTCPSSHRFSMHPGWLEAFFNQPCLGEMFHDLQHGQEIVGGRKVGILRHDIHGFRVGLESAWDSTQLGWFI